MLQLRKRAVLQQISGIRENPTEVAVLSLSQQDNEKLRTLTYPKKPQLFPQSFASLDGCCSQECCSIFG